MIELTAHVRASAPPNTLEAGFLAAVDATFLQDNFSGYAGITGLIDDLWRHASFEQVVISMIREVDNSRAWTAGIDYENSASISFFTAAGLDHTEDNKPPQTLVREDVQANAIKLRDAAIVNREDLAGAGRESSPEGRVLILFNQTCLVPPLTASLDSKGYLQHVAIIVAQQVTPLKTGDRALTYRDKSSDWHGLLMSTG